LPSDFIPSTDDSSATVDEAIQLQAEYNIDFSSCIGSLIYLEQTRTDILFAVNKLAKFTRCPGVKHMEALVHLLRYLRDNTNLGVRFYSDISRSPVYQMLTTRTKLVMGEAKLFTFSDSSWNDDADSGRSTGAFLCYYMGGVVDHSSNMPDPVAMSSAESEYNEGCVACMAASHCRMLLDELELKTEDAPSPTVKIIMDSKSAIAMGESFKDTKHTRHIMRRFHFVRHGVEKKFYELVWIPTEFQLADIGTKNLPGPRQKFLTQLLMVSIDDRSVQEG
jgi:hypothetical protein